MAFGLIGAALAVCPLWEAGSAEPQPVEPVGAAPLEDTVTSSGGRPSSIETDTQGLSRVATRQLLLPTGETVPVLNDAYGAPPLRWEDDRPWSPIVGVETDGEGTERYVHEDGSRTITRIIHVRGDAVPATSVEYPEPSRPLEGVADEPDRNRIRK